MHQVFQMSGSTVSVITIKAVMALRVTSMGWKLQHNVEKNKLSCQYRFPGFSVMLSLNPIKMW